MKCDSPRYKTEQEALAAAYRIHCNMEGGYIDGIDYTPYAESTRPAEITPDTGTLTHRYLDMLLHTVLSYTLCASFFPVYCLAHSLVSRINMPYSSAQLINHPACGIQPNVHFYDFNWNQYLQYLEKVDPTVDLNEEQNKIQKVGFFI